MPSTGTCNKCCSPNPSWLSTAAAPQSRFCVKTKRMRKAIACWPLKHHEKYWFEDEVSCLKWWTDYLKWRGLTLILKLPLTLTNYMYLYIYTEREGFACLCECNPRRYIPHIHYPYFFRSLVCKKEASEAFLPANFIVSRFTLYGSWPRESRSWDKPAAPHHYYII